MTSFRCCARARAHIFDAGSAPLMSLWRCFRPLADLVDVPKAIMDVHAHFAAKTTSISAAKAAGDLDKLTQEFNTWEEV